MSESPAITEATSPPPEGFTVIAERLRFPEGPVAMPDGSVVVVEMFAQRLTSIAPDGTTTTVADVPGGPNGAALGPDGMLYVCNNGGRFTAFDLDGFTVPGPTTPGRYLGGRVQAVDPADGSVCDLYTECDGNQLIAPNDLVFDGHGGFYFTDHGNDAGPRTKYRTGIFYAKADGSGIREVVFPVSEPNGIGLSPDGTTLYWAETFTGRLMQRRIIAPGELEPAGELDPTTCLHGFAGLQLLDSLGVDAAGNVCVATLLSGGISVIAPDGALVEFIGTDDPLTTNITFGGPDLTTAYVTLSGTGRVASFPYPRGGVALHQ